MWLSRQAMLCAVALLALVGCTSSAAGGGAAAAVSPTPAAALATPVVPTPSPQPVAAFPFTLTDSAGRQLELKRAPTRIISVSPGFTEVLFAIGAGGHVIGVDDFSDYPAAAKDLTKVGYSKLDLEKIVGLNPDLVLLATRQKLFVTELEKLGLPAVLYTEPDTVAGVFDNIRLMGRVTGRTAQAEDMAKGLETRLSQLSTKLNGATKGPRIFHELTPDLYTVGPKSFIGNMYQILKADNVVRDPSNPFPKLSLEALIAEDPEYVFLADGADLGGQTPEIVKARPGWSGISAVKNDHVYIVDGNVLSRPGPRVVEGIEELARRLYPDRFR